MYATKVEVHTGRVQKMLIEILKAGVNKESLISMQGAFNFFEFQDIFACINWDEDDMFRIPEEKVKRINIIPEPALKEKF